MAERKQKEISNISKRNDVFQSAINRYFEVSKKVLNNEREFSLILSTMNSVGVELSKNGESRIYFDDFGVYYNKITGGFFKIYTYSQPDIDGLYKTLAILLDSDTDNGIF